MFKLISLPVGLHKCILGLKFNKWPFNHSFDLSHFIISIFVSTFLAKIVQSDTHRRILSYKHSCLRIISSPHARHYDKPVNFYKINLPRFTVTKPGKGGSYVELSVIAFRDISVSHKRHGQRRKQITAPTHEDACTKLNSKPLPFTRKSVKTHSGAENDIWIFKAQMTKKIKFLAL